MVLFTGVLFFALTVLKDLKRSRLASVSALVQKDELLSGDNPFCLGCNGIRSRPKGSNSLIASKIETIIATDLWEQIERKLIMSLVNLVNRHSCRWLRFRSRLST